MRLRREDTNPMREMPFTAHLEELRWTILRSLLYVVVAMVVMWYLYDGWLRAVFIDPIEQAFTNSDVDAKLIFTHFLDPLFFKLQVVATASVLVTLPLVLHEIWRFVAPGLYQGERRHVGPLLPFSVVLAFLGAALVYFAVPLAITFLLKFLPADKSVSLLQDTQKYYYFFLRMLIGSAVAFQSPLVFMVLGKLEIVSSEGMLRYWRHAILVNCVAAAVITPTVDPWNMSIVAGPLCFLYFLSVALVRFNEVGRRKAAAATEAASASADAEATAAAAAAKADEPEQPNPRLNGPIPGPPAVTTSDEAEAPVEGEPPPAPAERAVDGFEVDGFDTIAPAAPAATPAPAPPPPPPKPAPQDEALFDPDADV